MLRSANMISKVMTYHDHHSQEVPHLAGSDITGEKVRLDEGDIAIGMYEPCEGSSSYHVRLLRFDAEFLGHGKGFPHVVKALGEAAQDFDRPHIFYTELQRADSEVSNEIVGYLQNRFFYDHVHADRRNTLNHEGSIPIEHKQVVMGKDCISIENHSSQTDYIDGSGTTRMSYEQLSRMN